MKRLITIGAILGITAFALPALAATTVSLTPATIKVTAGQQFNVVVAINPTGTANYAEKVEVDYPAGVLSVSTFTLGSTWTSLSQPGYDSIDNAAGVMIKTAGYAGGITSTTPFGTITFTAKKSGTATISIGNGSQAFQSSSQAVMTGTGASVTIAPATTATETTQPSPDLTPVTTIDGSVVTPPAQNTQTAAVTTALPANSGGHLSWIVILGAIIVVVLIGYAIARKKRKPYGNIQ